MPEQLVTMADALLMTLSRVEQQQVEIDELIDRVMELEDQD